MIACECGGCGSVYKVKDQNAGKKFKCKHCDDTVRVPARKTANGGSSSGTSGVTRKKAARPKRQQPEYDEYDDYEDDGYDSYDDDGSGGYDDYGDDGYDDYEAPKRRSPSRSSSKSRSKSRSKKKRRSSSGGGIEFGVDMFADWRIFLGLPLANTLLMAVLTFIPALAGIYTVVVFVAICGLSIVGGILGIVKAFEEDAACGLMYMFLPFYALIFTITRWEVSRGPFMMQMTAVFMLLVPIMIGLILALFSVAAFQVIPNM